jgi:hypothetical protein
MMMEKSMKLHCSKRILLFSLMFILVLFYPSRSVKAQIWEPEGLNMPGLWNGWTNPPVNTLALASYTQVPGGLVTKIPSGIMRWHTTIKVAASGGDVVGGTYPFLFTTGPTASPWQNAWKDVTVVMNSLQDYIYYTSGGADNQITVTDGHWYSVNWKDNGYANSQAIFMETTANPVEISSVTQSPLPGQVAVGQAVTVTVTLGAVPCAQELFYLRYSNDSYATSHLVPFIPSGTTGTAVIPATTGTVSYYVFSTTVASPTSDFDMYSIKVNNNGGTNYSFYYNTSSSDITFQVNMSLQTVSPDGVHLVGDFQGWNTTATPMANLGGGIYAVTIPLPSGSYQEYKFLNGNSYAGEETVPSACGADNGSGGLNRFLTIPVNDTVLGAICFSSCVPCSDMVSVTFYVDMSQQSVSADGVHLVGDFQSWNSASTPMTLTSDSIYSVSVTIPANSYQEYKFLNGNTYAGEETVPEACGADNGSGGLNRYFTADDFNMGLQTVCFSSCEACAPPPLPVNVTFKVNMSEEAVSADGIHLVGDFQGWSTDSTQMTLIGNNIYSVTLSLDGGSYHEFKFINGITWENEESVPAECGVDDGSGGFNRFVTLTGNDTILIAVCFSSCEPCPTPPATSVVTFKVDMQDQVVSPDGVHLAGNFQGWDPAVTPMTLIAGGVYEASLLLDEGYLAEYKFINGVNLSDAEIVPAECGVDDGNGGFNRFLTVPLNDTVTGANCFSQCTICHVGLNELPGSELIVGKPWPNPSTGVSRISYTSSDPLIIRTNVYNMFGSRVVPEDISCLPEGNHSLLLDLHQLIPGVYTVIQQITSKGQLHTITRSLIIR